MFATITVAGGYSLAEHKILGLVQRWLGEIKWAVLYWGSEKIIWFLKLGFSGNITCQHLVL